MILLSADRDGGAIKTIAKTGTMTSHLWGADGQIRFLLGEEAKEHATLTVDSGSGTAGTGFYNAESQQR